MDSKYFGQLLDKQHTKLLKEAKDQNILTDELKNELNDLKRMQHNFS